MDTVIVSTTGGGVRDLGVRDRHQRPPETSRDGPHLLLNKTLLTSPRWVGPKRRTDRGRGLEQDEPHGQTSGVSSLCVWDRGHERGHGCRRGRSRPVVPRRTRTTYRDQVLGAYRQRGRQLRLTTPGYSRVTVVCGDGVDGNRFPCRWTEDNRP